MAPHCRHCTLTGEKVEPGRSFAGLNHETSVTNGDAWDELNKYYVAINNWRTKTANTDVPWAVAETGWTDKAASLPQNATAPDGKTVSPTGTGADWLTRGFDDMRSMGGIAMAYFHVAPSTNNEPADWTWPVSTSAKINAFKKALAKSARFTSSASSTPSPPSTPSAPTNLTATATGPNTVAMTWNGSSGATSYTLRRNGAAVSTTTKTSYTDSGLTPGTNYTYTVLAANSAGTSGASNPANVATALGPSANTPVTFRASSTAQANAAQATITLPPEVQPGDTMVMFVSTNTGAASSAVPAGWSKVGERSLTDLRTEMWTRVAGTAEAGAKVTVDLPVQSKIDVTLVAYSGAVSAKPISTFASRSVTVNATNHQSPGLTLPDSNSVVLTYWVDKSSSTSGWTLPVGQIQRSQNVGSGNGRLTSIASDLGRASAVGDWAPVTATANAVSSRATIWSVALTAAP